VRTRSRRHQRLGQRHLPRIFVWIFLLIIAVAAGGLAYGFLTAPRYDFGVVEAVEPITVRWWINDEKRFIDIRLRPDARSDRVAAFSHYTFKGIWEFGLQPGNNPLELNKVLSRTLSLPLNWYMTPGNGATASNMPWASRIFYLWQQKFSDRKSWKTIDLTDDGWYRSVRLADGTRAHITDTDKIAKRIGQEFEISQVRKENIRVSVINTSARSGLADDFAKILGNIGIYVGLVSSHPSSIDACLIRGETEKLESATARAVQTYFGCGTDMKRPDGPFDMEIFIGESVFPYR
jgi:hypothetical protein